MMLRIVALVAFCAGPFVANAQGAGERAFAQCTMCHGVVSPSGAVIHRAAPTGPNLWGVAGRVAGAFPGYNRYSSAIQAAGASGIRWTEDAFVAYVTDPTEYLRQVTGDPRARSNMNHRLSGSARDIYAYLAQFR